jgi:hypothetical protein
LAGKEISITAPTYLRNIEEGKREKKSWYRYVFLEGDREIGATDGRHGVDLPPYRFGDWAIV